MALKELLPVVAFLGLGCRSHFQAHDDYESYPESKKEIALYNINHLLKEVCSDGYANGAEIHCEQSFCCEFRQVQRTERIGNYTRQIYVQECSHTAESNTHSSWSSLTAQNVVVGGDNAWVDLRSGQDYSQSPACNGFTEIILVSRNRASSLAQAIQVYLE